MRRHRVVPLTAAIAAISLVTLAAGPSLAAQPVAQAEASAYDFEVAGNGSDSGTYRAVHDGTSQSTSGNNQPVLQLAGGQDVGRFGGAAQQAVTEVTDGRSFAAACAGIAGEGATMIEFGDGDCLVPADAMTIDATTMDFSDLRLVDGQLRRQLVDAGFPVETVDEFVRQISGPLGDAFAQGMTALGDLGLVLDLGAVQATCTAENDRVEGAARLTNVGLRVSGLAQQIDVLDLPVDPAPNTHLATDLGDVSGLVLEELRASFEQSAASGPLAPVLQPLLQAMAPLFDQSKVLESALATLGDQLAPLEENVLDVTLNEQSRADGSITVTALRAEVLPVAEQFLDNSVVDIRLGTVACGPNGPMPVERAAQPPAEPAPEKPSPSPTPTVPTSVPAGMASTETAAEQHSPVGTAALLALLLVATGAGVIGYRRARP